jgi:hypothetical protein
MKKFGLNELIPRLSPKGKEHWVQEMKTRGQS